MDTTTKVRATPKDFFLWAGAMVALYVSVVSLLNLLFEYINYLFPDPIQDYYVDPYAGTMRLAMASLFIIFPVYLLLTRILNQDLRRNPEKKDLWVRKWLVYLTLFVAGITLIVDLVVLINTFLGGDLTTRFLLKVLSVLVVVGSGFLYYLYDLRGRWETHESQSKMIGAVTTLAVIVAVLGGFFIVGSPTTQRLYRADAQRVSDLQSIQWQVVNYWQQKEELPANFTELEDPISGFKVPKDRETGAPYEYRVVGQNSFELCATFAKESRDMAYGDKAISRAYPPMGIEGENWQHGEGRVCFTRTIDPERYPPYPKQRI